MDDKLKGQTSELQAASKVAETEKIMLANKAIDATGAYFISTLKDIVKRVLTK